MGQDYGQQDDLTISPGDPVIIPNVGDSVTPMLTGENKVDAYKVVSRHFSYSGDYCCINIVVTDLDMNEYAARIKM